MVEITVEAARGNVPVVAGAGGYNTAAVIELARSLEALGVDQFAIYLMHDQKDETLNAYGQRIIPALS